MSNVDIAFSSSFDVGYLKKGEHTHLIPLPENIAQLIGQVVVHWGAFEHRLDLVTETLLARLYRTPPHNFRKMQFQPRRKLFRDTTRDYTEALFPSSALAFQKISDTASSLHIKRNAITHGYIEILGDPETSEPTFVAHYYHRGQKLSYKLEAKFLEQLRHDIAHLTGNMLAEINRMGGYLEGGLEIVIPDTDLLQDSQLGSFQLLPISNTRQFQQQPSWLLLPYRLALLRYNGLIVFQVDS